VVSSAAVSTAPITDCELQLRRIDAALYPRSGGDAPDRQVAGGDSGDGHAAEAAGGADATAQRAYLVLKRARLSGVPDELRAADAAVNDALRRYPDWPDLCFLRASADLDLHLPGDVFRHLDAAAGLAESPAGLELRGAACEQLGRHADAQELLTRALAADPSWQALAGLAQLRSAAGDPDGADALYGQAEDELTAKQMSAFAWVRASRGTLAADAGRYDIAWAHYRAAAAAFSGYWHVDARIAGLLRRESRLQEAATAYAEVRARTSRPELAHALGDVHRARGAEREAAGWYAVALAEYQASVARGEVLYLHHLAAYHRDRAQPGSPPNASSRSSVASGKGG
jgi:tetratricopeptide (TPR) repeat protein